MADSLTKVNMEKNNDDNAEDDLSDYYDDDFEESELEKIRTEFDLAGNKTFSNLRIHEIDHDNALLMKKVLAHTNRPQKIAQLPAKVKTSAEINRQKQQRKIEHDNLILLKKIQKIKPFGLSKNNSYN